MELPPVKIAKETNVVMRIRRTIDPSAVRIRSLEKNGLLKPPRDVLRPPSWARTKTSKAWFLRKYAGISPAMVLSPNSPTLSDSGNPRYPCPVGHLLPYLWSHHSFQTLGSLTRLSSRLFRARLYHPLGTKNPIDTEQIQCRNERIFGLIGFHRVFKENEIFVRGKDVPFFVSRKNNYFRQRGNMKGPWKSWDIGELFGLAQTCDVFSGTTRSTSASSTLRGLETGNSIRTRVFTVRIVGIGFYTPS